MEEVSIGIGSKGLEDLKKIKAFLATREVAGVDEIAEGTGIVKEVVSNRLNFWRAKGEIYKIAFNQWSLNPNAFPRELKSKLPYKKKDPHVKLMYDCFRNMVRVGR